MHLTVLVKQDSNPDPGSTLRLEVRHDLNRQIADEIRILPNHDVAVPSGIPLEYLHALEIMRLLAAPGLEPDPSGLGLAKGFVRN